MGPYQQAYLDRQRAANKMQAFYQPAYFGKPQGAYSDPFGGGPPMSMGGFEYGAHRPIGEAHAREVFDEMNGSLVPGPNANPLQTSAYEQAYQQWRQQQQGLAKPAMQNQAMRIWDQRAMAPTYGKAQLSNYGLGALNSYGRMTPGRR